MYQYIKGRQPTTWTRELTQDVGKDLTHGTTCLHIKVLILRELDTFNVYFI